MKRERAQLKPVIVGCRPYSEGMGQLEERIVDSLTAFRNADPDCDRHMFVFPVTLMNGVARDFAYECDCARNGEVMLFYRSPEPGISLMDPASGPVESLSLY